MQDMLTRIKRMLAAQQQMEKQAQMNVVTLLARKREIEQQTEKAMNAPTVASLVPIFSDFYIRHLHRLAAQQIEVEAELDTARQKLRMEKKRAEVLQTRLKKQRRSDDEKRENETRLETLARGPLPV